MTTKNIIWVTAATLVLCVASMLPFSEHGLSRDALTASYDRNGRFRLTNNTPKTLIAQLWYVETKTGADWTQWGAPNHQVEIGPHGVAFDTISFTNQSPPTTEWRLRGSVGEKLEGCAEALTALRYYPNTISLRLRTDDTNVSLHPFPKGISWYGNHRGFVSQAVSDF